MRKGISFISRHSLVQAIRAKESFLCIGLDPEIDIIPAYLHKEKDPIFEFTRRIIDATVDVAVAYKPNLAFYEALGPRGLESFQKTIDYIPEDVFCIADAKRGDIGNTSKMYAKTFFDYYGCDAVTVSPYMGEDSVAPFLGFEGKWVIVLALTSNTGAFDFQTVETGGSSGEGELFAKVINKAKSWGNPDNTMFVAGATRNEKLSEVRSAAPEHFLLIPGVGAQGGDLSKISRATLTDQVGIIINASRSIIYAGSDTDFDKKAKQAAVQLRNEMRKCLDSFSTI